MSSEFTSSALALVKARMGISSNVRDTYLNSIINGVVAELEQEKELVLNSTNSYHLMFVVDLSTWRYQNRDSPLGMPRHLQFRLHNLVIHVGAQKIKVNAIETVDILPLQPDKYIVYILDSNDSKKMYINDVWVNVDMVNGVWILV